MLLAFLMSVLAAGLAGCASVSLADGGHQAVNLYRQLAKRRLLPAEQRVFPLNPLPMINSIPDAEKLVQAPPLIKGYLRVGTEVIGAPAWDPDFNTADLPMLMQLDRLPARYRKHFLG